MLTWAVSRSRPQRLATYRLNHRRTFHAHLRALPPTLSQRPFQLVTGTLGSVHVTSRPLGLSATTRNASNIASAATSSSAEGTDADKVDAKAESSKSGLRDQVEHSAGSVREGDTPITRYESLVAKGLLKEDDHQRKIIGILQEMHDQLKAYSPKPVPEAEVSSGGIFSRLFSSKKKAPPPDLSSIPLGLYLYGSVGTGKTMLMDLFYDTLPASLHTSRKRVHFHAFMLDVFRRVHEIKHGLPRTTGAASGTSSGVPDEHKNATRKGKKRDDNPMEGRSATGKIGVEALSGGGLFKGIFDGEKKGEVMDEEDAIYEVAREMAREGRVLCFDEFQVTDIVTAMILRQLLERMMSYGVVCIMTSNRHPDELYMNGIQRGSFLPCIDLIKERFRVVDLNSGTDYRRLPKTLSKVYFSPLDESTHLEMQKLFDGFTNSDDPFSDDQVQHDRKLHVFGRTVRVPQSTKDVARFSFNELCGHPLSSADYLEITKQFGTIFVEEVPRMSLGQKDMARRFITFIDACYESKTRLFLSSEVNIYQIFSDESDATPAGDVDNHMRMVMDDLGLAADDVKASSMFTGQEELFAFARCVSRLVQMGTKEWTASTYDKRS